MRHRFTSVVILLAASLFVSAEALNGPNAPRATDPAGLVVHEWGTFTSVAGEDGAAVEWVPPNGPQDLPCFVSRVGSNIKGWLPATVRMETPVLYFYSSEERTVDVRVRFRRGIISEWYPRADVAPAKIEMTTLKNPALEGTIAWNRVRVMPRAAEEYPVETSANHYYAARKTDASPIEVGSRAREVSLLSRHRQLRPSARRSTLTGRRHRCHHIAGASVRDVMLFENKGGAIGYDARPATARQVTLESPAPASTEASVRASLTRMLVAHGLYEKEAAAMVETWRDSWFEEGTRLFYIVPQASIDGVLPLDISSEAGDDCACLRRANRAHYTSGCPRGQRGDSEARSRDDRQARALSQADSCASDRPEHGRRPRGAEERVVRVPGRVHGGCTVGGRLQITPGGMVVRQSSRSQSARRLVHGSTRVARVAPARSSRGARCRAAPPRARRA